MQGPQHYKEAERLITLAETLDWQDPTSNQGHFAMMLIGAAGVHVGLAQCASAIDTSTQVRTEELADEWAEALA